MGEEHRGGTPARIDEELHRLRAETDALRGHYRLLDAATQFTPDALYVKDVQGRYLMINPAGALPLGKSAEDVVGKDDTDLLAPESARRIISIDREILAEGFTRTLEEVATSAGTTRWYLTTKGPYRDDQGRVIGVIGSSRDITERKRAQEALALDSLLLANVRDSVIVTDLEGIITYWNEGANRLFGWRAEEMIGRHYSARFPEPVRSWIVEELRSRAEGTSWSGEYEDYRKDGSRVWIEARVNRFNDADGKPAGILGLAYDITDRVRAEEWLARARNASASSPSRSRTWSGRQARMAMEVITTPGSSSISTSRPCR